MTSTPINFDRAVAFYDATRGFPPEIEQQVGAFIARHAALHPHAQVLEIGIGTGRVALPLAPQVGAVYGIDVSAEMMQRLREKQHTERVYVALSDAAALPFPAEAFDAALVVHVFHLIQNLEPPLRELRRVLKPGGLLLSGFAGGRGTIEPLSTALQAAHPVFDRGRSTSGQVERIQSALQGAGWQQVASYTLPYSIERTPQSFLDDLLQRRWSSTWSMSDEELALGIAAVRHAIVTHFNGNAAQVVRVDVGFALAVYRQEPP